MLREIAEGSMLERSLEGEEGQEGAGSLAEVVLDSAFACHCAKCFPTELSLLL